MSKMKRIKLLKSSLYGIFFSFLIVSGGNAATIAELQARAAKLETEVSSVGKQSQQIEEQLNKIEEEYQEEISVAKENPQGVDAYDAKIAAAKAKKEQEAKTETKEEAAEKVKDEAEKVAPSETKEKVVPYPLERNPRYVAPKNTTRGRRPFTKSDNDYLKSEIHYAQRNGTEELSFAKEEAVQAYVGTTEENVFVFSDNLANYCKFDTTNLEKMTECLNSIISKRAEGTQSAKGQMNELFQESLIDTTTHAIADAARFKNDSSGYEKDVLLPLQEKSSKATDERGDIEVLTLTEMEALKLKNKLLQIYATQLGLDAFRDFGTFEVNNRDLTNIDEETE